MKLTNYNKEQGGLILIVVILVIVITGTVLVGIKMKEKTKEIQEKWQHRYDNPEDENAYYTPEGEVNIDTLETTVYGVDEAYWYIKVCKDLNLQDWDYTGQHIYGDAAYVQSVLRAMAEFGASVARNTPEGYYKEGTVFYSADRD